MDDSKCCYISIGTNEDREVNLDFAHKKLCSLYPDILFSPVLDTKAIGMKHACRFLNQVACFHTHATSEETKSDLKRIEIEVGRTPEEKVNEIIRLDLDLLIYDGKVLKPYDLKRNYVREGLAFFHKDVF